MNMPYLICTLLLTLLLPIIVLASSVELFYTSDELEEMGVHLGYSEADSF
jgi:hypothetical protein